MRAHNLTFVPAEIVNGTTAWIGRCDCGWLDGPHYLQDAIRAYWADHVHLTDESECALHGTRA